MRLIPVTLVMVKSFVYDVEDAVRIRTGEHGDKCIIKDAKRSKAQIGNCLVDIEKIESSQINIIEGDKQTRREPCLISLFFLL